MADRIRVGLSAFVSPKEYILNFLKELLEIYQTSEYLKAMRKYAYYFNINQKNVNVVKRTYWKYRYVKLVQKLGFNAFGYGLLILHVGNNIMAGANSLVNKSFDSSVLLVGSPAEIKKQNLRPWYEEQVYQGIIWLKK